MFDFLKKKIKDFVGTLSRKEEKKIEEEAAKQAESGMPSAQDVEEKKAEAAPLEREEQTNLSKTIQEEKAYETKLQEPKVLEIREINEKQEEKLLEQAEKTEPEKPAEIARKEEKIAEKALAKEIAAESKHEEEEADKEIEELVGKTVEGELKREQREIERRIVEEKRKEEVAKKVFSDEREEFLSAGKERDLKPKVGIFSQFKGLITGSIEIGEKETEELFRQFEMALLESDVSYSTAQALISDLRRRLIGKRVQRERIQEEVKKEIAFSLASVLQASRSDFYQKVTDAKSRGELPFIVLFLGPNGMGKTTTIAKIAHNLKKRNITSVISASDTFRAAAIEQALHHGEKLGLKVVKHKYGADPAAVAFDAINYARAHKVDVVLIDTAGRQETNLNLLAEMQKIVRVTKPNLKVFIAEAIAGTSLVNQVKTFNEKLGVDGIVLTKLDADAKGGGSLSIAHECKLPIYFVGTGQQYDDLLEFNEEWIVKNIMAE